MRDISGRDPLTAERLRLWIKLLQSSSLIEEEIRRRLRSECGSTLPRFDVMAVLSGSPGGVRMGEVSKRLRVSNGNITGIVDKLESEGLAARVPVPGDRRANLVSLTAKGRAVFAEQAATHEAWIDEILGQLNADDIDGMIRRLDPLIGLLQNTGKD
jgi:DNA-binding MarR family transcriptional regulator